MTDTGHHKASGAASGLTTYSVRRMRNTAVLVKWIEDHQSNPYPTKAEKQYLAYYSGMNLTQLSTWFANARRRIKKIGMKTWLEGRSTFSLDTSYFPSSSSLQARADTYSGVHKCKRNYHILAILLFLIFYIVIIICTGTESQVQFCSLCFFFNLF